VIFARSNVTLSLVRALANYNGTVVIGEHTQGAAQQRSPRNRFACPRMREAEIDYRRSGIFPIMHTLVIRTSILERQPATDPEIPLRNKKKPRRTAGAQVG